MFASFKTWRFMHWQSYTCKGIKWEIRWGKIPWHFPYSEKLWAVAGVKSPAAQALSRMDFSSPRMWWEGDFHDFLRAEELLSIDTHWGGVGEGTCLGKGSAVWALQHFGSFEEFGKSPTCEWVGQRLSSSLCLPWGKWCQTTALLLTSGRAQPWSYKHQIRKQFRVVFVSQFLSNSAATQGFNFSEQSDPALAQSRPEDFPLPEPGKQQMGCRLDVVALSEPSLIPAALFRPPLPPQPSALAFSGFHSCHSPKSKMGLNLKPWANSGVPGWHTFPSQLEWMKSLGRIFSGSVWLEFTPGNLCAGPHPTNCLGFASPLLKQQKLMKCKVRELWMLSHMEYLFFNQAKLLYNQGSDAGIC